MSPRISSRTLLLMTAAFIASRVGFHRAGVRFDTSRLETMWQFLDANLLRTDLARSLLHLHAQPPLYNLFLGVVLKLFPGDGAAAFHAAHLVIGWAASLALVSLLIRLGVGTWLAVAATTLLMVSPAFVLYESWLSYSFGEL